MSFQETFASTIISLVQQAYHSGVLQYHPMTVANITVTLTMFEHQNQLAVQSHNHLLSARVYDSDSTVAQNATIANLLADLITKL